MSEKCENCLLEQRKIVLNLHYTVSALFTRIEEVFYEIKAEEKRIEQELCMVNDSRSVEILPF